MHNDHLGSVSLVTNESGAVVEQTFYEPFGKVISGGTASRYQYEGKEYSSVVGDYDFHARKVNPDWGVFTQPDTIIQNVYDPQMLNRYSFERNNPENRVDPDGHVAPLVIAGAMLASGLIMGTAFGIVEAAQLAFIQYEVAGEIKLNNVPKLAQAFGMGFGKGFLTGALAPVSWGASFVAGTSFFVSDALNIPSLVEEVKREHELETQTKGPAETDDEFSDIGPQSMLTPNGETPNSNQQSSSFATITGYLLIFQAGRYFRSEEHTITTASGYSYSMPEYILGRYPGVDWSKKEKGKGLCLTCKENQLPKNNDN